MPKKKPIAKRLDKLFDDIQQVDPSADSQPRPVKRAAEQAPPASAPPPEPQPQSTPKRAARPNLAKTQPPTAENETALALAFQTGQNNWATLQVLDDASQRVWTEEERLLVQQVTDQLSLALENARLFQEAQRRAREMTALAEVGREISATLSLEAVLDKITGYARELLQAESSAVYLPNTQGSEWKAISAVGLDSEAIRADILHAGTGILGNIINSKTGRIVNDAASIPETIPVTGTTLSPYEHIMGVPILSLDRVTGLMAVWRTGQGKEFTPSELDFLTSLSQQTAIAIENARLYENSQYNAAVDNLISQISSGFVNVSVDEVDQQINLALQRIARFSGIDRAYLFQFSTDGTTMDNTHEWVDEGIASYINDFRNVPLSVLPYMMSRIQQREIFYAPNVGGLPDEAAIDREELLREHIQSIICVPIQLFGQTRGFIGFDAVNQTKLWGEQDINMLRLVGEILTGALQRRSAEIENRRLFEEVTESQSQLSEALQIARIGYFEIDWPTQQITITDELFALLNTSAEREGGHQFALDQSMQKFVVAEDIPLAFKAVEAAISGKSGQSGLSSEVRYKAADGRVIWVSSTYKVERDAAGEPIKVAGSSQDITERKINELTQAAITQISESALTSKTLEELLQSVHEAAQTLLPARNFYAALYDQATNLITFPYAADEFDTDWAPRKLSRGLTSYVIRTGRALRTTPEIYSEMEASGEIVNDGVRNIDWLGVPLRSKQVVTGVIAIQTYDPNDRITEKHREILTILAPQVASAIERFLAEREIQKFKLGIDRSDNAVFITDLDGIIQYANPAFEKVYGFKPSEAIGNTPRIIRSGLIPAEGYKQFWDTLLAGGTVTGELTNRKKDGTLIPVAGTNSPILDETGKTIGFLAVHQDITERKQAEQALQRRNTYLAASSEIGRLVTSTLDLNTIFTRTVSLIGERFGFYFAAIYVIDETGFHAALREAKGEAGEKMKTQRYSVAVGSQTLIGQVADTGQARVANDVSIEPLHQPNPLLLDTQSEAAIPLRVGERRVGVIDIQSRDLNAFTEDELSVLQSLADQVAIAIDNASSYERSQELIKELQELDQLKSQFLANMSHELRTPLNSIIGFSRVILKGIDGPVTEMQHQDLTAIYNSGQHLLGLINDILDLARIEAGKMELNFEEVKLSDMVHSVLSTAKGLVKEKPIQLVERIPAEMPTVRGDTMRVRQVLINLLSNASKFTDEGSITVESLVQTGPTGKPEALIKVIDTGPGISEEGQAKLFRAFSQVDGSATRKTGGSGLGLSICANLVQLHGGQIGVTSAEGKGSTFWFTLPLFHQPKDEVPEGKKVILAIDDDPQVISLYERYLNPQGYYVVPLTDGSKAREKILELKPYAVTLDIMMPNLDGWTLLTTLKSDPETRQFPVVICSIIEQTDKGFNLGASDYLVKPILEEDLVDSIHRLNKNGNIHDVLVIDDDPNDLRLIEKIIKDHGQYNPILAEGGRKGWEAVNATPRPQAIILDIFMPDVDGFSILEKLRENPELREIPVLVVSGGGLTNEQHQQLADYGKRLIAKGSLATGDLIASIESALKRIG